MREKIKYRLRVHIGTRSNGAKQLQLRFTDSLRNALKCDRATIEIHGKELRFIPAESKKKPGHYSIKGEKIYSDDVTLIKYAKSFEGEYMQLHRSLDGYIYVDATEARPFTVVLPSRSKPVDNPVPQAGDAFTTLRAAIKRYEEKRDKALEAACEYDKSIEALKAALKVLEGGNA